MSFRHGKTTLVVVGTRNISRYMNDSTVTDEIAANESTTYGEGAKLFQPGLEDVQVSMSGLFDGDESPESVDTVLAEALKSDDVVKVLVVSDSPALLGRRVTFLDSVFTNYEVTNPVADLVSVDAEFQGTWGASAGRMLAPVEPVEASVTFDEVDGGSYTSARLRGRVHVLANDRDGDVTFQVERSADGSAWVAAGPSMVVAGGVREVLEFEIEGNTERYQRLAVTVAGSSGSVSFAAAAARL